MTKKVRKQNQELLESARHEADKPKKKSGGRPSYAPNEAHQMLARALGIYGVPRSGIAKMIGIDVKTLNKHYGSLIQNSRMEMGATAISVIYKGMNSRTESIALATAKYFLSTIGKPYGWTQGGVMADPDDIFEELDFKKLSNQEFDQLQHALEKSGLPLSRLPEWHDLHKEETEDKDDDGDASKT